MRYRASFLQARLKPWVAVARERAAEAGSQGGGAGRGPSVQATVGQGPQARSWGGALRQGSQQPSRAAQAEKRREAELAREEEKRAAEEERQRVERENLAAEKARLEEPRSAGRLASLSQGMGVVSNNWFDCVLLLILHMFKPSC